MFIIIKNDLIKNKKDFITYDFKDIKYDNIIANPPYIKIQNLSISYRNLLKNKYEQLKNSGSIDLYYAFILKIGCITMLYVTSNSDISSYSIDYDVKKA